MSRLSVKRKEKKGGNEQDKLDVQFYPDAFE
jgi:hypothetical protein